MRARRFPLTLRIRCRRTGDNGWIEGVTINISSSGVLFHTSEPLEVDTHVEMSIVLGQSRARAGELRCDGAHRAHRVRRLDDAVDGGCVFQR